MHSASPLSSLGEPSADDSRPRPRNIRKWIAWVVVLAGSILGALWFYISSGGTFTNQVVVVQRAAQRASQSVFDLGNLSVARDLVRSGGPRIDGIPALVGPKFVSVAEARYLKPSHRVIGVTSGDVAKAYPLMILNYHEAVNDHLGTRPILVTYCPLCDSVAVFDRTVGDEIIEFGISGMLYNSNVLLYDRSQNRKKSLWSQLQATAVAGPMVGKQLQPLPFELTTWQEWSRRYPATRVLSIDTGTLRNYGRSPYAGYFQSRQLMFPVRPVDRRLALKDRVLGVWSDEGARAYPLGQFEKADQRQVFTEHIGDKQIIFVIDAPSGTLRVEQADEGIFWMNSLWFSWAAFHPETEIFSAP